MAAPAAALAVIRTLASEAVYDSVTGLLKGGSLASIVARLRIEGDRTRRTLHALDRAQRLALNRTLDRAHTRTVREIAKRKGLRRSQITRRRGRRGRIQKVPAAASNSALQAPAAILRVGTSVPIPADRPRQAARARREAHITPLSRPWRWDPGDEPRYWVRKAPAKSSRLPIHKLTIELAPEVREVADRHVRQQMQQYFPSELRRQAHRLLGA